jgi:hypothetical protein
MIGFLLLFAPLLAHADFSFTMGDDGYYPNNGNKHTNISKVELFIYDSPGVTFTSQGATNLGSNNSPISILTWDATRVNPTYVAMEGWLNVQDIYWTALFSGTAPETFRFDYLIYGKNEKLAYAISMTIVNGQPNFTQGSGWVALDPKNLPNYNRNPVPLPPSAWLLGVGLVGTFLIRRKMAKQAI